MLSPCLFNIYAHNILWNARLDKWQAGIKIVRRNINYLRYAHDTTLVGESEEELKSLLKRVKEESEKAGLILKIQKIKIMASGPITSWQTDGEEVEIDRFYFLMLQNHHGQWLTAMKLRHFLLGRKAMRNLDNVLKSRDITLPIKVSTFKAMVFPVVRYGCESWTVKKAEDWRIDAFELWCWRRFLRFPWTAKRSNQSILPEINPEYSLKVLILKLKLHYFGDQMLRAKSLEKTLKLLFENQRGRGDRGWDGWVASLTHWTWGWASSRRQWRTGRPVKLQTTGPDLAA